MKIYKASTQDFHVIYSIVQHTIKAIYPNYYPTEVVDFFLRHHNEDNIMVDLNKGSIYLLSDSGQVVGTGTIDGNYIGRVYVLPEYQGKGYGAAIMNYLEQMISGDNEAICLDASLPSYSFYSKMGYYPVNYLKLEVENGRILCYNTMEKKISQSEDFSLQERKQKT